MPEEERYNYAVISFSEEPDERNLILAVEEKDAVLIVRNWIMSDIDCDLLEHDEEVFGEIYEQLKQCQTIEALAEIYQRVVKFCSDDVGIADPYRYGIYCLEGREVQQNLLYKF